MVSQIVVLGVATSVGLWFAVRWMRDEFARVDNEIRKTRRIMERMHGGPVVHAEFDAKTGHYHPFGQ
ncbi:MAG: hypothetical protein P8Y67_09050 [Alphaproteobacteria bacterium]